MIGSGKIGDQWLHVEWLSRDNLLRTPPSLLWPIMKSFYKVRSEIRQNQVIFFDNFTKKPNLKEKYIFFCRGEGEQCVCVYMYLTNRHRIQIWKYFMCVCGGGGGGGAMNFCWLGGWLSECIYQRKSKYLDRQGLCKHRGSTSDCTFRLLPVYLHLLDVLLHCIINLVNF